MSTIYPQLIEIEKIKTQPKISFLHIADNNKKIKLPVNDSGRSILKLCDGTLSLNDIVCKLSDKYSEEPAKVREFVMDFLTFSQKANILAFNTTPTKKPTSINIVGNSKWWSPDTAIIELTHRCPLTCKHCYLGDKESKDINFNKLLDLCKILKQDIHIELIQLTGGEPLLYPHIDKVIEYISENNIQTSITTSGYISNDRLKALEPAFNQLAKVNGKVQISIDGFSKHHNWFRGKPDSFEKAITLLDKLISFGIEVHVGSTITKESIQDLSELSIFLKGKGVRVHRIGSTFEMGYASQSPIHNSFMEELKKQIELMKQKLSNSHFSIQELEEFVNEDNSKYGLNNCGAGSRIINISPDLKVFPCPKVQQQMGDLTKKSLTEILKEKSVYYSSIKNPSPQTCNDCTSFVKCEGCYGEALINKDKVKNCSWIKKNI